MRRWITGLGVALVVTLGVALLTEAPALAASGESCTNNGGNGYFCLYQQKNYLADVAGDRWQTSIVNLDNQPGNSGQFSCLTIGSAKWKNGTPITDNTAGMQFNHSVNYDGSQIIVYNWVSCNPGGGAAAWLLDSTNRTNFGIPDLSVYRYPGTTISLYHTITSVGLLCTLCD